MTRRSRIVIPAAPHHVTQRGARRQDIFFGPEYYQHYLNLLSFYCRQNHVEIISYCLMTNHVHLILVPSTEDALSDCLARVHQRYATDINKIKTWKGHLWQQRYYSSPLEESHLWTAMRYIAQNPVRAKLITNPIDYPWSSAKAHCGLETSAVITPHHSLQSELSRKNDWIQWLKGKEDTVAIDQLRAATKRDLPCGSEAYIQRLEDRFGIPMRPGKVGRPAVPPKVSSIPKLGTGTLIN